MFQIHRIHFLNVTTAGIYVTRCVMLKANFFPIAIIAFAAHFSSGLYFHISETKRKCFVQDIPDGTTVLGKPIETKANTFRHLLFVHTFHYVPLTFTYLR